MIEYNNDNRNCMCCCKCDCESENETDNCPNIRDTQREEMLMKIKELDFAIIELGLYLDTHPDDQKALCLHKEYSRQVKDLKDKYQKVYGPLTIFFPCNKWRWLEEPWPSFILEVTTYLQILCKTIRKIREKI